MRTIILACAATAALAVAGCGDDDNGDGSGASGGGGYGGGSSETQAKEPAPAAEQERVEDGATAVKLASFKFAPATVTVKVGDKITWTNDDSAAHNVTATSGADFGSGTLNQGGTFAFTPKAAGAIAYECTLHPGMTGKIEVDASAAN